ncbi:MAG: hypothetical protein JRF41_09275 [Deltaproteobacteria bacterium]|nr:hypothetical protein [Deltaproteobacteria bacterium]
MNDEKRDYPPDEGSNRVDQEAQAEKPGDDQEAQAEIKAPVDERASSQPEEVKADFHPFYEKEAKTDLRVKAASTIFLYILLAGLGLALLALTIDALFKGASFKLEITAATLVCIALIGLLWKSVTLEAKAGLAAVTAGLILAWPQIKHVQEGIALPWVLSADYIWPVFFLIALASILLAIWLFWPKIAWLPAVLSLPVLYGALAPVFSLVSNTTTLEEVLLGPSFMKSWPVFIRSGYLAAEVILPLGILLMIILQVKTFVRKHHKNHFGYIFWAIFLALASTTGLSALEAKDQPVVLPVNQIAKNILPASELAQETKTAAPVTEAKTKAPEQASQPPEQEDKPAQEEPPLKAEPAPVKEPETSKITDLEAKVEFLEKALEDLKIRFQAQGALIEALQNEINSRPKEQPSFEKEELSA